MKVDVLDKGFVQLVDHMGSDLSVVNAARVSFAKESVEFAERDAQLIAYLAKHNHWSPFSHPQITVRVKAPIFVRTQCFKHKIGFAENEVSRRYVDDEPEVYIPAVWRTRPENGMKQGSGEGRMEIRMAGDAMLDMVEAYKDMIAQGVAPEQARMILPQATMTTWIWTGSLAAFARFYSLRIDPHAQWEIQQYAKAVADIVRPLFPVSWENLTNG